MSCPHVTKQMWFMYIRFWTNCARKFLLPRVNVSYMFFYIEFGQKRVCTKITRIFYSRLGIVHAFYMVFKVTCGVPLFIALDTIIFFHCSSLLANGLVKNYTYLKLWSDIRCFMNLIKALNYRYVTNNISDFTFSPEKTFLLFYFYWNRCCLKCTWDKNMQPVYARNVYQGHYCTLIPISIV